LKICILPKKIQEVVQDLVERVAKAKDSTALLAVDEEEALVVMTWTKYEELLKAASAPTTHTKEIIRDSYPVYPYIPKYWWNVYTGNSTLNPYTGNVTSGVYSTSSSDYGSTNMLNSGATAVWLDTNE
jgi:hypothetical protein